MTLRENQYQIGDVLFGNGTPIRVSTFQPGGYEVTPNDRNMEKSDELSFGFDMLTPQPIAFEMSVIDNFDINRGPDYAVPGWESGPELLERLGKEWRADSIRKTWNSQKSITYKKNGPEKVIFGRPRKMTVTPGRKGGEFIPVVAEFMPVDTLAYSSQMFSAFAGNGQTSHIVRQGGGARTWVQILIAGPATNPKVVIGDWQVEIQSSIAVSQLIEVNSYPWQRRVIDSTGQYLSAKLIGDSAYMDEMRIPPNETTDFTFTCTGATGTTQCYVFWREAYLNY